MCVCTYVVDIHQLFIMILIMVVTLIMKTILINHFYVYYGMVLLYQ